jgi:adenine deaminase
MDKNQRYLKEMASAALGEKKAELVIKNAQIIQVFTNEIIKADIAITKGIIVGVGQYHGEQEMDATGRYVCPGFIDAHLHLESTLVNPAELILQAGLKGTTTFIVDPHEAANVSGCAGIDYILNETKDALANVYVMVPSCVPSGPNEDNGFVLLAEQMSGYLSNPRILGLGEVMDCDAVLNRRDDMMEKIHLFQDKVIDGHAGYLSEKETNCYALAGISTDHECCTFADALREMRAGMQILVREGTAAKNLEAIISGVVKQGLPCHQLAFCTDDKHIEDIRKYGHISYNVKKAIKLGVAPIEAIKMATWYPAKCYGLRHLGAIAPGYQADFLLFSDLEQIDIEQVFYKGKMVVERELLKAEIPPALLNTVNVKIADMSELQLHLSKDLVPVIETIPGEILTKSSWERVAVRAGQFVADGTFQKIAVFERHHATGKKGIGIVKGFSLTGGAIASTVSHDAHNLIVVGDNDPDMYRSIQALIACGGGYVVTKSGAKPLVLPLPVMGLISVLNHKQVSSKLGVMLELAHELGVPNEMDPFITLSFLALPVIPQLRITTRGLVEV